MIKMSKNLTFLLLSAFLLTQCCPSIQAKSVESNESKSSSEETDVTTKTAPPKKTSDSSESSEESEQTERMKLLAFTLAEIVSLGDRSVSQGKILFKNALEDLAVVKVKSESLEKHITTLTKFVEEVDKYEANSDAVITLFNLMEEMGDILENTTTAKMEAPNSEDLLVETTLKKHGLDKFSEASEKDFMDFAQRFETAIVHYFDTLSEKEKESEAKMINWYKEYKIENNLEKKLELLPKFIDSFGDN